MKKIDFEDVITAEELSQKLGLTVDTLEKWRKKGMPTIKIEKYLRFYWPKVLDWIVKQEEKTEGNSGQGSLWGKNGKN
jgi:hypothetical protein